MATAKDTQSDEAPKQNPGIKTATPESAAAAEPRSLGNIDAVKAGEAAKPATRQAPAGNPAVELAEAVVTENPEKAAKAVKEADAFAARLRAFKPDISDAVIEDLRKLKL